MQQFQKTKSQKYLIGIIGVAWIAGLLIAGSDNAYMPWVNGMGLCLFLGASILLAMVFRPSSSHPRPMIDPGFYNFFQGRLQGNLDAANANRLFHHY